MKTVVLGFALPCLQKSQLTSTIAEELANDTKESDQYNCDNFVERSGMKI